MDKLQQLRALVRKRHDENWEKRNNSSCGTLCWERALEDADILAIIDSIPRFKVGDVIKSGSYTYTIKDIDEDSYILDGDKVLTFNAQYDWELVKESQRMVSAKAKEAGYSKPASEDLEEAAKKYADEEEYGDDVYYSIKATFKEGANWQKEQFEKNRLAACDAQTSEEAEREMNFATNIIEKEHRTPTYDDAIKYGMRLQKEEMMKDVVLETTIIKDWDGCAEDYNESEWLAYEDDDVINMPEWCEEGDKVKLILIKSE